MPDPIQAICSRVPNAAYDPRGNTCRWTELGSEITISRNKDGIMTIRAESVSALTAEARGALCKIFNDPRVDLPDLSDDLWNLICD
jgi:hypothetical protein